MSKKYDSIFHNGETDRPAFADVSFQNERAMWWAEFDSVGEDAVRGYVERNAYTPTGMEIARQWLARREFLQLREEVQSIKALAEQGQGPHCAPAWGEAELSALTSQADANSRAIAEIAAAARKNTRTMVLAGSAAFLFSLGAFAIALASSRPSSQPAAPKLASAQPARAKPAATRPLPPAVPPVQSPQALSPEQASVVPPENVPPENIQTQQQPDSAQIDSPDPAGRSVTDVLALIADKVGGEGAIDFTAEFYDAASGRGHSERLSYKASNVTIDPNRCQVGYHWHVEQNGRALSDQNRTIDLGLAKSVRVTSIDAESGRRFSMRADPQVHVVHIARWDNASGDALYFRDQGTAARVGMAARHAVKLCGNGEPPRR